MIRVAIIDDHPMILKGIEQMLRPQNFIQIEGLYTDVSTLMKDFALQQPDILLLDIQMPGMKGDEITTKLLHAYPALKIIAITNFDNLFYIRNMLKNGAKGYLLKTTREETLIEAIRTVAEGGTFIDPSLKDKTEKVMEMNSSRKYHKLALTSREIEIIKLLTSGHSNQQIADKLFISYNTMRNHRARIFLKLDVNTIGELIIKAIEMDIK